MNRIELNLFINSLLDYVYSETTELSEELNEADINAITNVVYEGYYVRNFKFKVLYVKITCNDRYVSVQIIDEDHPDNMDVNKTDISIRNNTVYDRFMLGDRNEHYTAVNRPLYMSALPYVEKGQVYIFDGIQCNLGLTNTIYVSEPNYKNAYKC